MIIDRAKHSIPNDRCITPGTTPIVYFGEYHKAEACTVSINPSYMEFTDKNGKIRKRERIVSRVSLHRGDNEMLSTEDARQVIQSCNTYFQNEPYRQWFDKYEKFINNYSYSYYAGTCVHLDLVQWATTPTWRFLSPIVKSELVKEDLSFLLSLLEKRFKHIFLNGRTVITEISKYVNLNLTTTVKQFNGRNVTIYTGNYNGASVIGWSIYLQSPSVGGYMNIQKFADLIHV